jgi:hypothetical protein
MHISTKSKNMEGDENTDQSHYHRFITTLSLPQFQYYSCLTDRLTD